MTQAPAGRSGPLHHRYQPEVFAAPAPDDLCDLEVLYGVGGLCGNLLALQAVLDLFDRDTGRKRLVFHGDFHWFDVDAARTDEIQHGVMAHRALRGHVETELALADGTQQDGPGCGRARVALEVAFDDAAWQVHRLRQWPAGSDAHDAYFGRIAQGPRYQAAQAVRLA